MMHDGPIKNLLHLEISNHFEPEQGTDNRFRPHPQGSGQGTDELIIILQKLLVTRTSNFVWKEFTKCNSNTDPCSTTPTPL